jgi:hypothetical protein
MLPWLVDMLALTCAGSVGTFPVRGGLIGLLALSGEAGYWQLAPRLAGAANGGSWPGVAGAAGAVDDVVAAVAGLLRESRFVMITVATTAAITTIAAATDPAIV